MSINLEQTNNNTNIYIIIIKIFLILYILLCLIGQMSLVLLIIYYGSFVGDTSTIWFYFVLGFTLILLLFVFILIIMSLFISLNTFWKIFNNMVLSFFSLMYLLFCLIGQISFFWLVSLYNNYRLEIEYNNTLYPDEYKSSNSNYDPEYERSLTIWWFSVVFVSTFLMLVFIFIFLKHIIQFANN